MKNFWKILDTLLDSLLALGILGIAVICLTEIIARSLLNSSIMWANEACRYLFVYVVFIGACLLTRDHDFICMDLIQSRIPEKLQFFYNLILQVLLIFYAGVMLVYGCRFAMQNSFQRSSSMHIPMNVLYIIMPLSGFLIIVYALRNIVNMFRIFSKGVQK